MIIILTIAILLTLIYIGVELFSKPLFAFYAKAFASFGFVVLALFGVFYNINDLFKYILIGLLFGMIGDLVLALRPLRPKEEDKTIILGGILSFSLGHIFYLIFLLHLTRLSGLSIILSILMTTIVIIASYLMKFKMGITRIPSYIYSALIFLMIGQSISYYIELPSNPGVLMLMIGAILFGISDLILAPIYYKDMNSKIMVFLNLTTYYSAQILIAYSLFFL